MERAWALLRVGRLHDAAEAAGRIARATTGDQRRAALAVHVEALRWAHALAPAPVEQLQAAGDETGTPAVETARALAVAAVGWAHLWDLDRGLTVARRALAAAEAAEDPTARCLALAAVGKCLVVSGRMAEGEPLLREAVELARGSDDPLVHLGPAFSVYIQTVVARGDFEHLQEWIAEQLHHAERLGVLPPQVLNRGGCMSTLVSRGLWDEATAAADGWWRLAVAHDIHQTSAFSCARAARVPLGRGDLEESGVWLERGERLAEHQAIPAPYEAPLVRGRALLLEAEGRPEDALAHLLAASERFADSPLALSRLGYDVTRLAAACGDLAAASATAGAVEWATADLGDAFRYGPFFAALSRALAGGPVDAAVAAFEALGPQPPIRADHLLDQEVLADVLAERGRRDDAVRLLHDATDAWEEIGAPFFAARTLAKLRALGVRRGARGSRDRPATGWEALTPTERQVADLILDGLTYREIGERQWISRRTVETHARHIFAKLGVANRRELATAGR